LFHKNGTTPFLWCAVNNLVVWEAETGINPVFLTRSFFLLLSLRSFLKIQLSETWFYYYSLILLWYQI